MYSKNDVYDIREIVEITTNWNNDIGKRYRSENKQLPGLDMLLQILDAKFNLVLNRIREEGSLNVTREADLYSDEMNGWVPRCLRLNLPSSVPDAEHGHFVRLIQPIRQYMVYPDSVPYVEPKRGSREYLRQLHAIKGFWCIPENVRADFEDPNGNRGVEYAEILADAYGSWKRYDCPPPANVVTLANIADDEAEPSIRNKRVIKRTPELDAFVEKVYKWRNDVKWRRYKTHTDRWDRVLLAFGEEVEDKTLTPMTLNEVNVFSYRGWPRWVSTYRVMKNTNSALYEVVADNESENSWATLVGRINNWRNEEPNNKEYTEKYDRALLAFGETVEDKSLTAITCDEAWELAQYGESRFADIWPKLGLPSHLDR